MSFFILFLILCALPALFLAIRFAKKKQWFLLVTMVILVLALPVFLFRPVCVPIENGEEEAKKYNYEQREDKSFYVKVFQKREGRWHHCKTWIARKFFF